MSSNWLWKVKFTYAQFTEGMQNVEYILCNLLTLVDILIKAHKRLLSMNLEVECIKM